MKPLVTALLVGGAFTLTAMPATAQMVYQPNVIEVRPGQSINAALRSARPGTDVLVRAGTYNESVNFTNGGNGTAPVRLISADGQGAARIVSSGTGIGVFADHAEVHGFSVSGGRDGQGIQFGGTPNSPARRITLANNTIENAGEDGIKGHQAREVSLRGNVIRRAGSDRNGNGDGGIDWVDVSDSELIGNTVQSTFGHACFMMKTGSSRNVIENNVLTGCERDGMTVGGFSSGRAAEANDTGFEAANNTIRNNTIRAGAGKCAFYFRRAVGNTLQGNNVTNGANGCDDGGNTQGPGAVPTVADGGGLDTPPLVVPPSPTPDLTPRGSSAAGWSPTVTMPEISRMRGLVESRTAPPDC